MAIDKMLASISADTSLIKEKLNRLFEMLSNHFSDELRSMVSCLLNNVVFVNGSVAVRADGPLEVVCILDFDAAAYDQIMTPARTFKAELTHK